MTLGELFIEVGLKAKGLESLKKIQDQVKGTKEAINPQAKSISSVWAGVGNAFSALGKKISEFFEMSKKKSKSFLDVATNFKKGQFVLMGAVGSIVGLVKKASDAAAELSRFSSLTGLSAEKLQSLQQQAAASGVAIEDVSSSIEGLQRASQDIQLGKGNIAPWAMLGIDPRQDPFTVLTQLQQRLKNFSAARGTALAEELGLSREMVGFLRESGSLGKSDKSLLMSDSEIKKLKQFNIEFNKAWDSSKRVLQKLALALMPIANGAISMWKRIVFDINIASKAIDYLGTRFKSFWKVLAVIGAALMIYFFPITSAMIAIALILEDFAAFSRGDDSVIGALVNWFKQWKEILDNIIPMLKYVGELIKDFAFDKFAKLKDFFGFGAGGNTQAQSTIGQVIPMGGGAKGGVNNSQTTNNVNINVDGSKNPDDIARKIGKKVQDVMSNTMYQQPLGATK